VLCNISAGIPFCETTRFGCVEKSYVVRPPVPQEVEPWNMAGTISCADPTARFPCIILVWKMFFFGNENIVLLWHEELSYMLLHFNFPYDINDINNTVIHIPIFDVINKMIPRNKVWRISWFNKCRYQKVSNLSKDDCTQEEELM
jgi:hypothetical protein